MAADSKSNPHKPFADQNKWAPSNGWPLWTTLTGSWHEGGGNNWITTKQALTNTISVLNYGKGIPVVMHGGHICSIPTLIFGHWLTGLNFDDDEEETTRGLNRYGLMQQ